MLGQWRAGQIPMEVAIWAGVAAPMYVGQDACRGLPGRLGLLLGLEGLHWFSGRVRGVWDDLAC